MARNLRGQTVHTTALALLPPEHLWEPIQEIRRKHDKHLSRWPQPHINLLYPFVPSSEFESAAAILKPLLAKRAPFRVTLRSFKYFLHGKRSATLWLDPACQPGSALDELQKALTDAFPFANDLRQRFDGEFSGHISVGQFPGESAVQASQKRFQASWKEVEFVADRIVFLSREGSGEDRFQIEKTLTIGSPSSSAATMAKTTVSMSRVSPKTLRKEQPVKPVKSFSRSLSSTSSASDHHHDDDVRAARAAENTRTGDLVPYGVPPADTLSSDELLLRKVEATQVLTGMANC